MINLPQLLSYLKAETILATDSHCIYNINNNLALVYIGDNSDVKQILTLHNFDNYEVSDYNKPKIISLGTYKQYLEQNTISATTNKEEILLSVLNLTKHIQHIKAKNFALAFLNVHGLQKLPINEEIKQTLSNNPFNGKIYAKDSQYIFLPLMNENGIINGAYFNTQNTYFLNHNYNSYWTSNHNPNIHQLTIILNPFILTTNEFTNDSVNNNYLYINYNQTIGYYSKALKNILEKHTQHNYIITIEDPKQVSFYLNSLIYEFNTTNKKYNIHIYHNIFTLSVHFQLIQMKAMEAVVLIGDCIDYIKQHCEESNIKTEKENYINLLEDESNTIEIDITYNTINSLHSYILNTTKKENSTVQYY